MVAIQKRSINLWPILNLVVFTTLLISSHSFAEIGSTQLSDEVAKDFLAYRFDPNYRYYFVNLENNPCAVVGLQKDYKVHDILWKEINPTSKQFKDIIELVQRFPMASSPAFGAYIADSQGKRLGVYYSSATAGVIVDKESKTVSLSIYMGGTHHN